MLRTPPLIFLVSSLLLASLWLTHCKRQTFEERVWHLLRSGHQDELHALIKQNPDKIRETLRSGIDRWTALLYQGAPAEATAVLKDIQALASVLDALADDGWRYFIDFRARQSLDQLLTVKTVKKLMGAMWGSIAAGQHEQALAIGDQAEAANRNLADPYLQAGVHSLRGQALFSLLHYREAQQQYEMARELYTRLGSRSGAAAVQSDLGFLYVSLGRMSQALQFYRHALAEQRRSLSLQHAARTLHHIGSLYIQTGDFRNGLENLQEALALEEQTGEELRRPDTLSNLGLAYIAQRQYARAEPFYRKALAAAEATHRADTTGRVLNNLGEFYFRAGQHEVAIEYLNKALEVKTKTKALPYDIAWTLRALGEVSWSKRQWKEAESYRTQAFDQVLLSRRGTLDAILIANIYNLQGRILREQGRLDEAAAAFDRAIQRLETELANLEAHHLKTSLLSSIQDIYHDMILLQQERLGNSVAVFEFAEKARARAFLDLISGQVQFVYGDQLASGARRLHDVLSTVHAQPINWASLQRVLPRDITVVGYTITKDQLLIWVLDAARLSSVAVPVTRDQLNRMVYSFREAVTWENGDFKRQFAPGEPRLREMRARGAELYKHLILPIQQLIPPHRMVCFIPDGTLYYIPFAALPVGQKYLVEEHTIFYAPSASILAWSLAPQKPAAAHPLLVVSNPEIGNEVLDRFPYLSPLRAAEQFDSAIAQMFRGAHLLRRSEASKAALLAAMPDHAIIHLSAHGTLDDKDPLLSSLVLAPGAKLRGSELAGQEGAMAFSDNSQLFMYEIFQLKLPRTRLLTLSACETALGTLWHGEGMVGMTRAVFSAGIPSLIVTQWKIEDYSAGWLMAEFYKQLRAQPNIAEALARAQRTYLQASKPVREYHPYYWAGFCLMGSYHLEVARR